MTSKDMTDNTEQEKCPYGECTDFNDCGKWFEPEEDVFKLCRRLKDYKAGQESRQAEIDDILFWREKLFSIIPQTYGEAIQKHPHIKCEGHEWDNRTTIENLEWLIKQATKGEICNG